MITTPTSAQSAAAGPPDMPRMTYGCDRHHRCAPEAFLVICFSLLRNEFKPASQRRLVHDGSQCGHHHCGSTLWPPCARSHPTSPWCDSTRGRQCLPSLRPSRFGGARQESAGGRAFLVRSSIWERVGPRSVNPTGCDDEERSARHPGVPGRSRRLSP